MSGTGIKYGRWDYRALSVLAVMIAAPFLLRFAEGDSSLSLPLVHDVGFQWIPFRAHISKSWSQGLFPLWCGNAFAGFPFASFSHTGVFYPPGWLFLISDYSKVVNCFYPLHLFVAASGVFFLCRAINLSSAGAWFASVSYVFCGKPFYFIHFLPSTCSNVWIPWFLFSAVCFLYHGRSLWLVLCAVFLALQVLGGDIESTAYSFFLSIPLLIILVRGHPGWLRRVPALVFILVVAGFLCLIQLLPLYEYTDHFIRNQGVTFSYFTKNSLSPQLFWGLLFPVKGIATTSHIGAPKPLLYLGFMSFVLAVFSVIVRSRPSSRGVGALALLALFWSFGSIPLLSRFQYLFPFLNAMDFPELSFFMAQLLLAILAGQAVTYLGDKEIVSRRLFTYGAAIALLCFAVHFFGPRLADFFPFSKVYAFIYAALLMLFFAAWRFKPGLLAVTIVAGLCLVQTAELYGMAFYYLPSHDHSQYHYSDWLKDASRDIRKTGHRYIMVSRKGLKDPELLYHAGFVLGTDSIDGWITVPPRSFAEVMALAHPRAAEFAHGKLSDMGINDKFRDGKFIRRDGVPILDLVSLGFIIDRELNLKFASPYQLAWSKPYYHRRECLSGPFRGLSEKEDAGKETFSRSVIAAPGEVYQYKVHVRSNDVLRFTPGAYRLDKGVAGSRGVFSIRVRGGDTVEKLFEESVQGRPWPPQKGTGQEVRLPLTDYAGRTVLLELSNPRGKKCPGLLYMWDNARITNPELTFQERYRPSPEISVFINKQVLPRAFVVHDAKEASGEKLLKKLSNASRRDLLTTVYVDRLPPEAGRGLKNSKIRPYKDMVRLLDRRPGIKKYRVVSDGPGLLFMSDQYYPGWRAFVEGEEVPVLLADHSFRAVAVQGGVNLVELRFQPVSFRIGLFGTLSGLFACLAFGGCFVFRSPLGLKGGKN